MISFLSWVIATFITAPLLALILTYFIGMKITRNKKKSFHMMIDYSTIIFIFAVYSLTYVIWEKSFLWIIILILLLIAMALVYLQWKINEEIQLRKVWKGFWRFNFLFFFISYFGLLIYGLFQRITSMY